MYGAHFLCHGLRFTGFSGPGPFALGPPSSLPLSPPPPPLIDSINTASHRPRPRSAAMVPGAAGTACLPALIDLRVGAPTNRPSLEQGRVSSRRAAAALGPSGHGAGGGCHWQAREPTRKTSGCMYRFKLRPGPGAENASAPLPFRARASVACRGRAGRCPGRGLGSRLAGESTRQDQSHGPKPGNVTGNVPLSRSETRIVAPGRAPGCWVT